MALGSQEVDEDRWGKELLFEELNIMGFVHIINWILLTTFDGDPKFSTL